MGGNATIAKLSGGEDYVDTSSAFLLSRNVIKLVDFLKLHVGGVLPTGKFLTFQSLRLFLVASETKKNFRVEEKHVGDIHCSPPFK